MAYAVLQFSFSELSTILFSSSITHSFYPKDPFSFKSVSTFGIATQCLVNVKMENYNQFLKVTFLCNRYDANIRLIRGISSGLRFKSFPSSRPLFLQTLIAFILILNTC